MTADQFQAYTKRQLADMARQRGIANWRAMRKDELVQALVGLTEPGTDRHPLRGSVLRYSEPFEPATDSEDWEAHR